MPASIHRAPSCFASRLHSWLQAASAASAAAAEEARGQLVAAKASYDAVLGGLRQQEAELLERVAELSRKGQDHRARSAAELEAATAALGAAQQKLAAAEADAAANKEQAEALRAEVRVCLTACCASMRGSAVCRHVLRPSLLADACKTA